MGKIMPEEILRQRKLMYPFMLILVLLLGVGFAALYSASYYRALQLTGDSLYYVRRQAIFGVMGIAGGILAFLIPEKSFKWIVPLVLTLSLALMLLTQFSPLGDTRLGARRWMTIGPVSFQPSEAVKLSLVLFLANYLGKHGERMKEFAFTVIPAAVILLFASLILLQRDFSTAVLVTFVSFSMVAVSPARKKYLLFLLLLMAVPGVLLLLSEEYRFRRILGFLYPELDPTGINYQVNMSLRAVASGGLFGTGFGLGEMKLGAIPEVMADFIFAAFAEETGLVGISVVWVLFMALAWIGYRCAAAHRSAQPKLFYLGFGCTSMIIWQALMNMGVVVGAVPPTGIPLPFFSLGGTHLFALLVFCGFIGRTIYAPVLQGSHDAAIADDYLAYSRYEYHGGV